MKKYFASILFAALIIVLSTENVSAQKRRQVKSLTKSGDAAFASNDYFSAALYYNQLVLIDSNKIDYQYKYAQASRLNFDYDIADHWYSKVIDTDTLGKLYPECSFWLASVKKSKGEYAQAKNMFVQFLQRNKASESYLTKKTQQEVEACELAQQLIANANATIQITHLDSTINSKVSEYAPFKNDSVLYFSSLRKSSQSAIFPVNFNKIYTSVQQDSTTWENSVELDSTYNAKNVHNANTSFNTDKTKMYITRCQQKNAQEFVCDIYVSEKSDKSTWSTPKKLPGQINEAGFTNSQPSVGRLGNDEVLFFASNRKGGEGKMDIWYSKINSDGTYGSAVNAGKNVNTVDDEITPFYSQSENILYFSSTWHKGLGGFDVFKSAYKDGSFAAAENAGVPINSNYNDIYFSTNLTNTEAYLSSNRTGSFYEEKESCCNDIYMFNIPPVIVEIDTTPVVDSSAIFLAAMQKEAKSKLEQLLPLDLYFHNDEPDRQSTSSKTKANYLKNYEDYSSMRDLYKRVLTRNLKPKDGTEPDTATAIIIDSIYAEVDTYFNIVDTGKLNLDELSRLLLLAMQNGEKITIQITSYCSPLAPNRYNNKLAKRRIYSITNYFEKYNNGALTKYIDNKNMNEGSLVLAGAVKGEKVKSNAGISDSFIDMKSSVFNLKAAYQRKVEISIKPVDKKE